MRNNDGFTPKEAAYDIAIGWIQKTYRGGTSDVENTGPPAFQKQVRRQLAKLNNRLTHQAGLDGSWLEEE